MNPAATMNPVAGMNHFVNVIGHAAETGGGPTGFGWASFVTFEVGAGVVVYSGGQFIKAVHARRHRDTGSDASVDRIGGTPRSTTP